MCFVYYYANDGKLFMKFIRKNSHFMVPAIGPILGSVFIMNGAGDGNRTRVSTLAR